MGGAIKTSSTDFITKTNNTGHLTLIGGTAWDRGGAILLRGMSEGDIGGQFEIVAHNGTTSKMLRGKPDGSLTWDGKKVVCVESWKSGNKWYRKYSDGWIEQGGLWNTGNTTLSFNLAFSDTNYNITGSENQGDDNARAIKFNRDHAKTTSIRMVGSANPIMVSWYACGY